MSMIDINDIKILRHAVGVASNVKRTSWGFRNRYVCEHDDPEVKRLVDAELMKPVGGRNELTGECQTFVVTSKGCEFIGLTPAQTKRALE